MKRPDIPAECGRIRIESDGSATVLYRDGYDCAWYEACPSIATEPGRAALASYCVTVIEWLQSEAYDMEQSAAQKLKSDEIEFWNAVMFDLDDWRDEWKRWGGLP